MKNIEEVIEYVVPKEVCKQLGIESATLRKYALLFDKAAENGLYFKRDERNNRLFTKEDVAVLSRMLELKETLGITLESATQKVLNSDRYNDTTPTVTDALYRMIETQSEQITKQAQLNAEQNEKMDKLLDAVYSLTESNKQLSDKLNQPIDSETKIKYIDTSDPSIKKGFFSRLFNK
ncbi:MAG: MerR family transcriptional regulator [Carnobacterium sp.]